MMEAMALGERRDYYSSTVNLDEKSLSAAFTATQAVAEAALPHSTFEGPRVWNGAEVSSKEEEWLINLSKDDVSQVKKALEHFSGLNLEPADLSPETFPLPGDLVNRLKAVSLQCYEGRGFAVVRGLDPEKFTDADSTLMYAGICAHVAPQRGFQDVNRELVTCHVLSEELKPGAEKQDLRPAFTNEKLAFHTDVGDLLSLFTLDIAGSGGKTMIVSSAQIYNVVAATRPDLAEELSKNWVSFKAQDYYTDGTPCATILPDNKLVFQYSRLPITGFRGRGENKTLPPPTAKRLEAMDLIETLAWEHAMPLPNQRGDIAFINNLCLMHARTPFDIDEATGKPLPSKRHLVKMMLRDPEMAWDLPESLDWYSKRIYGPNREDGTRVEKWQLTVPKGDDGKDGKLPDGKIWVGSGVLTNG